MKEKIETFIAWLLFILIFVSLYELVKEILQIIHLIFIAPL